MSDISEAAERLDAYVTDLDDRCRRQREWHEAHPEWPTCSSLRDAPDELVELHNDECADTRDILTSERFVDMIRVIVAAYREATRG